MLRRWTDLALGLSGARLRGWKIPALFAGGYTPMAAVFQKLRSQLDWFLIGLIFLTSCIMLYLASRSRTRAGEHRALPVTFPPKAAVIDEAGIALVAELRLERQKVQDLTRENREHRQAYENLGREWGNRYHAICLQCRAHDVDSYTKGYYAGVASETSELLTTEVERARCLRIVRDRMARQMPDVNRLTSMVQGIEGGKE